MERLGHEGLSFKAYLSGHHHIIKNPCSSLPLYMRLTFFNVVIMVVGEGGLFSVPYHK